MFNFLVEGKIWLKKVGRDSANNEKERKKKINYKTST